MATRTNSYPAPGEPRRWLPVTRCQGRAKRSSFLGVEVQPVSRVRGR